MLSEWKKKIPRVSPAETPSEADAHKRKSLMLKTPYTFPIMFLMARPIKSLLYSPFLLWY